MKMSTKRRGVVSLLLKCNKDVGALNAQGFALLRYPFLNVSFGKNILSKIYVADLILKADHRLAPSQTYTFTRMKERSVLHLTFVTLRNDGNMTRLRDVPLS